MLQGGVTIAYAESIDTVPVDVREVRPTIITGVPRFFEKVHARVLERVHKAPTLRRRLFEWGMAQGTKRARAHFAGRDEHTLAMRLADRLGGHTVREGMGGRLRFCISGGAALNPHTMEFFFAIGVTVLEGYGLTETSPVICLNLPGRERPGSVGPPVPGVEVRIGEQGEVLARGANIMQGYFRDEAATQQALRDGWFHTGDIGRLDDDGYLHITDRLKDLLVLAGGKKVAPQPIEAKLKQSPLIGEAVLLGDARPYIVCLVAPAFDRLEAAARGRGWSGGSRADLVASPEARALVQTEIERVNADLAKFETVKGFAILGEELTQENGMITPSLKVKRKAVTERYAEAIRTLYAGHFAPA
jgi:long-chain acyl-CoA synthetase